MKNMYIENLRKKLNELRTNSHDAMVAGVSPELAMKELLEFQTVITKGANRVLRAYDFSRKANLDELVFDSGNSVKYEEIDEAVEFLRKAGIRSFVYTSGDSYAFVNLMRFQEHGLEVGQFVVKEYEGTGIHEGEMQKLAGIRINLD